MSLPSEFLDQYDEPFGYMDFASIGTLSKLARRRHKESVDFMSGADGKLVPTLFEDIDKTKELVAWLMGTDSDHVAVVPSTSAGLFATAFGIAGGSVILPDTEFPANQYPWLRAAELGRIELRFVNAYAGRCTPDVFAEAMDSTTAALVVSQVDYFTGYRADMAGLREAAGDALLVVDSVQAMGALQSPMAHADVVVAGSQKWLRAGVGVAVMAMSDRALERLEPTLGGWQGVEEPFDMETPLPHKSLPTPYMFAMGSPAFSAMGGLRGSIETLQLGASRGHRGDGPGASSLCRGAHSQSRRRDLRLLGEPGREKRNHQLPAARTSPQRSPTIV